MEVSTVIRQSCDNWARGFLRLDSAAYRIWVIQELIAVDQKGDSLGLFLEMGIFH